MREHGIKHYIMTGGINCLLCVPIPCKEKHINFFFKETKFLCVGILSLNIMFVLLQDQES